MGESESLGSREPGSHDDSETIQFGGLPFRLPFPDLHLPRMPSLPPTVRAKASLTSVTVGVALLAVGVLIGFFGGRLTAHQPAHKARSILSASSPVGPPFGETGARCAVQVGNNLQLGIEIMNQTQRTVTLGAIKAMFPLGGLRTISSGVGPCGALPDNPVPGPGSLGPSATGWIHITVAVRLACPQPLPVWFKVSYNSGGKTGSTVIAAFNDLGPVSYSHCQTDQNASAMITIVENGNKHSSGE